MIVNNGIFDKEKIRLKIQLIEDNLRKLEMLKKIEFDVFITDFRNVETAKHLLQVSIEAMLDIANHIIARLRLKTPVTSRDSFLTLQEESILDKKSTNKYILMTKFRNRIVHLYYDVAIEDVYEILKNDLDDFRKYIQQIVLFLKTI
ncbi:MAG: DUF86 domain-containing protein [Clostridiales bacterium]|nr:DUF86 domain-containing protein [Clostridiales bacterium]